MSDPLDTRIRVIKAGDVTWDEVLTSRDDDDPSGREFTAARSADDRFTFGVLQREKEDHAIERHLHEVSFIIEGEVEVTDEEGAVTIARHGDIVVTPQGSSGYWRNLTPVTRLWASYEDPGVTLDPYIGPGPF